MTVLSILTCGVLACAGAGWATQEAHWIVEEDGEVAGAALAGEGAFEEKLGPVRVYPSRTSAGLQGPVAPAARQPTGSLSGRIVFTSAGHGWTADSGATNRWYTQRDDYHELVEDLGNIDQMTMFVAYCFNAGATVIPMRPVGYQTNEVVLDNDDAGVEFSGQWSDSAATIYYGEPGDAVAYRFATATSSGGDPATARYTPTIPAAGFYPLYTWARAGSNRVDDQLYRIAHTGGISEVRINHRRVGNGWIYLGTYYFNQGTAGYVEISNESADTSQATLGVIADAIRFGNGMGDVDRGAGVSGKPREDEASRYWVQRGIGQGQATSIYDRSGSNDSDDNVGTPPRMAAAMNVASAGTMTDRVYLGFHSNAYDPGSLGLYNGNNIPSSATPNQKRLAEIVAAECNDDLSAIGSPLLEHPWPNRRTLGLSLTLDRTDIEFGEINNSYINNEFDATIIEVAAHGNQTEARDMLDAKCRNWLARACCQALTRYFNEFGGGPLAFLPEPPTHVRAKAVGPESATISWNAPPVDGIGGQAATGYVVYRSRNGLGFGYPVVVAGGANTSVTVSDLPRGEVTYFRVAATNAGGESMPSETLAVRPPVSGFAPILVVNGFDRINRTMNIRETAASGIGGPSGSGQTYDRVKPRLMNSYDYVIEHGEALKTAGWCFDSCANEAVAHGHVDLQLFDVVVWILGEESTTDETFSSAEQAAVGAFLESGGCLMASGSEIGWDLDRPTGPTAGDRAFYNGRLMADFLGDDGGSYQATGVPGTLLGGLTLNFAPDFGKEIYDAESPDQMIAWGGSVVIANYSAGGTGGAAIQYSGGMPNRRVAVLGFPFECISPAASRAEVMSRILDFFYEGKPPRIWMVY